MTKKSLTVTLLTISISSWAANPCMPIAQACMQQGYYKGGASSGKGLIEDCVKPVVAKAKTLPNTTFTDDTLQQCATAIAQKSSSQQAPH